MSWVFSVFWRKIGNMNENQNEMFAKPKCSQNQFSFCMQND